LTVALSDTLTAVRRNAAIAIGRIGDKNTVDRLIPLLSDDNYSVRYAASSAIADIGDKSVSETLINMISTSDPITSYHIIETIGKLGAPSSIEFLIGLTENPNEYMRGFAYQALSGWKGNFEINNTLKKGLSDNSAFVRMMAATAIDSLRSNG
jgi:HEAT repeat protein